MAKLALNIQIQTERLLLRDFVASDFDAVFAFESDPKVVQYVCWGPYDEEECRRDLEFHISHQAANPRVYYHLAMVLATETRLIGWCGLEVISRENREVELGYALNRHYWGQGYATEAARALLHFGFEQIDARRIFASTQPANKASIHVLEKLGMCYEGRWRKQKWCRGEWRDNNIYALLEDEVKRV